MDDQKPGTSLARLTAGTTLLQPKPEPEDDFVFKPKVMELGTDTFDDLVLHSNLIRVVGPPARRTSQPTRL